MTAQQIQTAKIATEEALVLMAKKAGVTVDAIAETLLTDPEGNTARFFANLVGSAMAKVPAMVA